MTKNRAISLIASSVLVLVILIAALMANALTSSPTQPQVEPTEPMACTQEAKLCPDGSYVGRNSLNNCEFDPCPGE